jgi:hypothetical protein
MPFWSFFLFALVAGLFPADGFAREMEDMPVVKLRTLDKVTARTVTFEANVGSTVKFGPLYIKIQSCRKAPPVEQPEAASFLQVWEDSAKEDAKWVFSGWMFASSPGLSSMDHPIYDVWVLDCLAEKTKEGQKEQAKDLQEGEGEVKGVETPGQPKPKPGSESEDAPR